ncbi:MAG: ABC transporter ATP-binding protein [candidate division NC10 bacterium]|nr:ABC transporter ATP-binding protein [candidate division NC10 bacterium]
MNELIRVDELRKTFVMGGEKLEVLKGLNLEMRRGEFLCIVGPSGVGKSTFLHLLGALDRPTAGDIYYQQVCLSDLSEVELAAFRNRTIGFVFQFHYLLPEFTALENVMIPLLIARRPREEARKRAVDVLTEVNLQDRLSHRPAELSGGERQRVAIARALIVDPEVILADEPTGNLDTKSGEMVYALLRHLNVARGLTLVVVTHNEELARRADRVVRMLDGRILEGA